MMQNASDGLCSAPFCANSRRKCPSKSFFPYPKDGNRCRDWVKNVGRKDLIDKNPEELCTDYCLCSDHFDDDQFMNKETRNRLVWNAVPTLFEIPSPAPIELPKEEQMNPVVVLKDCMADPVPRRRAGRKRKDTTSVEAKKEAKKKRLELKSLVAESAQECCAVPSCRNNRFDDSDIAFFQFPRDSNRCQQWARFIGRDDLVIQASEFLNKRFLICADHFDSAQFMNFPLRRRLTWDAMPMNLAKVTVSPRGRTKTTKLLQSPARMLTAQTVAIAPQMAATPKTTLATPTAKTATSSQASVQHILSTKPPISIEVIKFQSEAREKQVTVTATESKCLPKVVNVRSLTPIVPKVTKVPLPNTVTILPVTVSSSNRVTVTEPKAAPSSSSDVTPETIMKVILKHFDEPAVSLWDICIRKNQLKKNWTERAKKLALVLYVHFPHEYRFLVKLFMLPSVGMLRRWMSRKTLGPGVDVSLLATFHDVEFNNGLKEGRKFFEEKLCVFAIQKVALKPHLAYDRRRGLVVGLEDLGVGGRSKYPATHALVMTVRGLLNDWSFPVGCHPVSERFSLPMYETLLYHALGHIESAGLLTKLIVLSDHNQHHDLLAHLNVTVSKPFVQFRSRRLIVMLSPIGLLRRFRHRLRESDLRVGVSRASWDHVREFHHQFSQAKVPLVPELTDDHIEAAAFSPMPSRMVTAVFQEKLAAGISFLSKHGHLPAECDTTASVIHLMGQLFDCFCGLDRKGPPQRPLLAAISEHSPHLQFLSKFLVHMRNWEFADVPKFVVDPALRGWHLTVAALVQLWFDTQKFYKKTVLRTKFFRTQTKATWRLSNATDDGGKVDCLTLAENQARLGVGILLSRPRKQQRRPKARDSYFIHLVKGLQQELHTNKAAPRKRPRDATNDLARLKLSFPEINTVSYIAGFLSELVFKKHACDTCGAVWVKDCGGRMGGVDIFAAWMRKLDAGCGSTAKMVVPTEQLVRLVKKCEALFWKVFSRVIHMNEVERRIRRQLARNLRRRMRPMCSDMRRRFVAGFVRLRLVEALEKANARIVCKRRK